MILHRCTRRFANLAAFFAVFAMLVAPAEAALSPCCCDFVPTNSCCVGEASPETDAKKSCCCGSESPCESSDAGTATDSRNECGLDGSCSCDGCDCILVAESVSIATVETSSVFAPHGASQLMSVMLEYPVFRVATFIYTVESLTSCDRCARLCRWLN